MRRPRLRTRRRLRLELEQLAQELEQRGAQLVELRVGDQVLQSCTVQELELIGRWIVKPPPGLVPARSPEPFLGPVIVIVPAP